MLVLGLDCTDYSIKAVTRVGFTICMLITCIDRTSKLIHQPRARGSNASTPRFFQDRGATYDTVPISLPISRVCNSRA